MSSSQWMSLHINRALVLLQLRSPLLSRLKARYTTLELSCQHRYNTRNHLRNRQNSLRIICNHRRRLCSSSMDMEPSFHPDLTKCLTSSTNRHRSKIIRLNMNNIRQYRLHRSNLSLQVINKFILAPILQNMLRTISKWKLRSRSNLRVDLPCTQVPFHLDLIQLHKINPQIIHICRLQR